MARYVATAETAWERDIAFSYLADFSHGSEWDPSIPRARCLTEDPLAVGARFEVAFEMLGRESELTYETIEIEAPRRVLLRAEMPTAVSLDEMTFDIRPGGGTVVTYDADIQFKGAAKLLDLPFRLLFQRIGDKARDGLRERLSEPQPRSNAAAVKT